MYNHSDLEERLRKLLQAPLPGPKARKFENGGSTDPEKEEDTAVGRKRFRVLTPEEVRERGLDKEGSTEPAEEADLSMTIEILSQQADELEQKFGRESKERLRVVDQMERLIKRDYEQRRMARALRGEFGEEYKKKVEEQGSSLYPELNLSPERQRQMGIDPKKYR